MREPIDHRIVGRRRTRRARWCALAIAAVATLSPFSAPALAGSEPVRPSIGEATDEGDVLIATPDGEPATNGGSTTPFRLLLPEGAACPGDSASGNWLVQTFLIPATDDPGEIQYGFSGPEGTQFPLYALDTRPVAHQVTRLAATPDGEGVINELPEFSFEVFPPGYIPPGDYTIGVACEYYRETARYWDAPIVIEANPDDQPAQLTWRLPDAEAFQPDGGSNTVWWIAIAVGVAVAFGVAIAVRRRPPASSNPSTSPSQSSPSQISRRLDDRLDSVRTPR